MYIYVKLWKFKNIVRNIPISLVATSSSNSYFTCIEIVNFVYVIMCIFPCNAFQSFINERWLFVFGEGIFNDWRWELILGLFILICMRVWLISFLKLLLFIFLCTWFDNSSNQCSIFNFFQIKWIYMRRCLTPSKWSFIDISTAWWLLSVTSKNLSFLFLVWCFFEICSNTRGSFFSIFLNLREICRNISFWNKEFTTFANEPRKHLRFKLIWIWSWYILLVLLQNRDKILRFSTIFGYWITQWFVITGRLFREIRMQWSTIFVPFQAPIVTTLFRRINHILYGNFEFPFLYHHALWQLFHFLLR